MHIVDGVLSAPVLAGGTVLAVAGIARGLKTLEPDHLPRVAVLSSAFFVASLVHVPVGPTSTHMLLSGLVGLALGWAAFPAIAVALFLQAMVFGFGGLTALGVNIVNMAAPAVLVHYLCRPGLCRAEPAALFGWGLAAGTLAIALSVLMVGLALAASGRAFIPAAELIFVTHLPVMAIEGLLVGAAVVLARQVKPGLFDFTPVAPAWVEAGDD
ncbi:MAG: cobalt transporter CbiM [Azospirillum sp.]|nr:cobalt transporter CbiM [Azospirillum sp.]